MRPTLFGLAVLAALACGKYDSATDTATAAQASTASANNTAAVQRAIDSAMTRFAEAMKNGDTAAMAMPYADDAIIMPANSKALRGRAELGKYNAGMLAQFTVTSASFTTTDLIVTGDYAIESGTYAMSMKPKTGKSINDVGKYISIWKKQPDGGWKMTRDIFNSDLEM